MLTTHVVQAPGELIDITRESPLVSVSRVVSQTMIDTFVALCSDQQAIHRDSQLSPAVVPGNLLIALVPHFLQSLFTVRQTTCCYTARYNKVRFFEPVYANDPVRASVTFTSVRKTKGKAWVTQTVHLLRETVVVAELEIVDVYFSK